jgi:hypothetical protein
MHTVLWGQIFLFRLDLDVVPLLFEPCLEEGLSRTSRIESSYGRGRETGRCGRNGAMREAMLDDLIQRFR